MSSGESPKETKSIGGIVSSDLYWAFKKEQAARHESTVQALENAIRLYLEIGPEKYINKEVPHE
ncbi:MAG: hypothetical protein RR382_00780 [Tannerellaceae bacterium]